MSFSKLQRFPAVHNKISSLLHVQFSVTITFSALLLCRENPHFEKGWPPRLACAHYRKILIRSSSYTVEFRRLGQCFIDWATAVVGEADRELTCVTLTYHSSGPIYETSAQSTKSPGTFQIDKSFQFPLESFCDAFQGFPSVRLSNRESLCRAAQRMTIMMLSHMIHM